MRGEDPAAYQKLLSEDLGKLQQALETNSQVKPIVFAYPFGNVSDESLDVIKSLGFRASMSCRERVNKIDPFNPDCLYELGRYNRPSGVETYQFFRKILD